MDVAIYDDRPPLPPRGPPPVDIHYFMSESVEGHGPYSAVPLPRPLGRTTTPPPYRMPPSLPPLPGAVNQLPSVHAYHTHSSKFPIERELPLVLSNLDKNNKIPILSEYNKRPRSVVPEGPVSQVAWTEPTAPRPASAHLGDRQAREPRENEKTKISKTYYTIKDMISNRFSKSRENVDDSTQMNNQGADALINPLHALALTARPRPNPPLPVLRSPPPQPNFSPSTELLSPVLPSTPLSTQQQQRRLQHLQQNRNEGQYATARAYVVQARPPAQRRPVRTAAPSELSHSSPNLTANLESNGVFISKTPDPMPPRQDVGGYHPGPSGQTDYQMAHSSTRPHSEFVGGQFSEGRPHSEFAGGQYSEGEYVTKMGAPRSEPDYGVYGPRGAPRSEPEYVSKMLSHDPVYGKQTAAAQRLSDTDDDGGFKKAPTPVSNSAGPEPQTAGPPPSLPEKTETTSPTEAKVSSTTSSDYEKATRGSSVGDSGRGSAAYSSGRPASTAPHVIADSPVQRGKEWADMVESELRHILDPKSSAGCSSTLSDSASSLTPPLPPLSPVGSSPSPAPRHMRFKHSSLPYGAKPDFEKDDRKMNSKGQRNGGTRREWNSRSSKTAEKSRSINSSKSKLPIGLLSADTDLGSTTTGPLDSVIDSRLSLRSSDEDLSTTIDATDAMAIRRQLQGLENMYSEVLKLLGVKKQSGPRYQSSDSRTKRRYGSMSSLPSSVSSRPVRDKRRDDRKKVRDMKGINKRFQRLESHVVTLARSVAHLSSEMRTQHVMIQEMEHIRSEMAALRAQTGNRSMSVPRALNSLLASPGTDPRDPAALTNPARVKKLTRFFGDEPPLLRIFLKRLGYEKYAQAFETEKIGMVELPYLTEERLQKMGIPMGPRLRILQEAQISFCRDSVYVV